MAKMTIEIDEKLLAKALDLSGAKTKKEALHKALDEFVCRKAQDRLIDGIVAGKYRGLVRWSYEEFMAQRGKGWGDSGRHVQEILDKKRRDVGPAD